MDRDFKNPTGNSTCKLYNLFQKFVVLQQRFFPRQISQIEQFKRKLETIIEILKKIDLGEDVRDKWKTN